MLQRMSLFWTTASDVAVQANVGLWLTAEAACVCSNRRKWHTASDVAVQANVGLQVNCGSGSLVRNVEDDPEPTYFTAMHSPRRPMMC
jgi:hypothetical protein